MKLVTKFSDYYDSAISYFMGSEYTWIRKREKFIEPMTKENDLIYLPKVSQNKINFNVKLGDFINDNLDSHQPTPTLRTIYMIGICGEWYYGAFNPYIIKNGKTAKLSISFNCSEHIVKNNKVTKIPKTYYWLLESVPYKHNNYNETVFTDEISIKDVDINYINWEDTNVSNADKFMRQPINPIRNKWWTRDIFNKYGPILLVEQNGGKLYKSGKDIRYDDKDYFNIITYPDLKLLRFTKVMSAYELMFKIDTWLNNQAIPDDAIVPVGDDVTRLQAYGFDKKTSFRKCKETK